MTQAESVNLDAIGGRPEWTMSIPLPCRAGLLLYLGWSLMITSPAPAANKEAGQLIRPESDAWLEITSIDDLLKHHPERVDLLLDALDLDKPGLNKVQAAVEAGDKAAACRALLDYYRGAGRSQWIVDRLGEPNDRHVALADHVLEHKVHKGDRVGTIPRHHGAWDWNHTGPKGNREFAYSLNRHHFFIHLLQAYRKTGEEKYAAAFDRLVRDWVMHTVYPGQKHQYVWTWRVLEAGLRMRSWLPAFHGFAGSERFSPAGRLLMLSSFVQHGRYVEMHHWDHHNHALMEHDGLNQLGLALPELAEAEHWHRYAVKQMLKEMDHQVYPDGAHDELSSGYHRVSLSSYENIATVSRAAGRDMPEKYRRRLVEMYDYWAGLVRPDGSMPQNNRSDRGNAAGRLLAAADRYDRPDWRYIATAGAQGERPEGPPSRFAPWAGHLVSRDDWTAAARWSFFDAGPAGQGWVHADALHLSVTAFGKDFLVDSGRFWYMRDRWTDFAHSSRSHNVILIDDREQLPQPKGTDAPLDPKHWAVTEAFDFARATHDRFADLKGKAAHTRIVVFMRGVGWVVVDRIATDRPRDLTAMWRYRPQRKVKLDNDGTLLTVDAEGPNLSITPVGPIDWKIDLVRGQEDPYLQGWHSDVSTQWEPSTCAELRAKVATDAVFGWVMLATERGAAKPAANADLHVDDGAAIVRFTDHAGQPHQLSIPLIEGVPKVNGLR